VSVLAAEVLRLANRAAQLEADLCNSRQNNHDSLGGRPSTSVPRVTAEPAARQGCPDSTAAPHSQGIRS
jgi:hypothetical protein